MKLYIYIEQFFFKYSNLVNCYELNKYLIIKRITFIIHERDHAMFEWKKTLAKLWHCLHGIVQHNTHISRKWWEVWIFFETNTRKHDVVNDGLRIRLKHTKSLVFGFPKPHKKKNFQHSLIPCYVAARLLNVWHVYTLLRILHKHHIIYFMQWSTLAEESEQKKDMHVVFGDVFKYVYYYYHIQLYRFCYLG